MNKSRDAAATRDNSSKRSELLITLEDLLVREFRTLQTLIALTKEERSRFKSKDSASLMELVEQKESILDQMGLIEDSRRMVTQDLARVLGMPGQSSTLHDVLSRVEPMVQDRLKRLNEGILMLVEQARDLNYGNRALAAATLEWVELTQAFLYNCYLPQMGYRPPGAAPSLEQVTISEINHKA
jgi:flagellar biosynthesis/type III secretory pathway chaperone